MVETQEMRHPQFRVMSGITFESAGSIMQRLGFGESTLNNYMRKGGFPRPIRFSRVRYFDPNEVDHWFLNHRR